MKPKKLFQLLRWKSLDSDPIDEPNQYYLVGGKNTQGDWKTKYIYIDRGIWKSQSWRANTGWYITHYAIVDDTVCDIYFEILPSNGKFSIKKGPYTPKKHPENKKGTGQFVDVIDHKTGNLNTIKLFLNSYGLHFKKATTRKNKPNEHSINYLKSFTKKYVHVPYQMKPKSELI